VVIMVGHRLGRVPCELAQGFVGNRAA
jgi:hypothetical protein